MYKVNKDTTANAHLNAMDIYHTDADWRKVDAPLRAFFEKHKAHIMAFDFEQGIALRMLEERLLKEPDNDEVKEPTAYYVKLLLKNKNKEADIIINSLLRLRNYWSREEWNEAAAQALILAREGIESNHRIMRMYARISETQYLNNTQQGDVQMCKRENELFQRGIVAVEKLMAQKPAH